MPPESAAAYRQMLDSSRSDIWPRNRDEFTVLSDGLELVDPRVVLATDWRRKSTLSR